jgi:hypothetical protein
MSEIKGSIIAEKPTQHAMLIVWGHYGREIGLMAQLAQVPIRQRRVVRAPYEKVVELLMGLLCGIEYLSDLSEGASPLMRDEEVAQAWGLTKLADASGVSGTLQACSSQTVAKLEEVLTNVSQPFWAQALAELRQKGQAVVLDADLTGRALPHRRQAALPLPEAERAYPGTVSAGLSNHRPSAPHPTNGERTRSRAHCLRGPPPTVGGVVCAAKSGG